MGALQNVLIGIGLISFFTFVALFGQLPALRRTPIRLLHRIIWIHIPKVFSRADKILTNGRIARWTTRSVNRILYEKHPLVTIFFLGLVTICAYLFLSSTWALLPAHHKVLGLALLGGTYWWTYLCIKSGPGSPHIITPETHSQHMQHYPFDRMLFHPNYTCRTCQFPKPARSKHCSLCGACVARADHHCIWVNNCLGRGNYKFFLALLVNLTIRLQYGAYLAYTTLKPQVLGHFVQYPHWHENPLGSTDSFLERVLSHAEYGLDILGTSLLIGGLSRGGVGLLALLTSPLPLGLLVYHLYLVSAGFTTNESGKWADWQEDMRDGYAFVADISKDAKNKRFPSLYHDSVARFSDGKDVNAHSRWPKRSSTFLLRTNDGQPPRQLHPDVVEEVGRNEWRRCWSLKEIDNIYDLGWKANWFEALTN